MSSPKSSVRLAYRLPNMAQALPILFVLFCYTHIVFFHGSDFGISATTFGRRRHNYVSAIYFLYILQPMHSWGLTICGDSFDNLYYLVAVLHVVHVVEAVGAFVVCIKDRAPLYVAFLYAIGSYLFGFTQLVVLWDDKQRVEAVGAYMNRKTKSG